MRDFFYKPSKLYEKRNLQVFCLRRAF